MRKYIIGISLSFTTLTFGEIDLKITSLTNTRNNVAMETCGTAKLNGGNTLLAVSVKHDESVYTTLTSFEGDWCVLIKRWTFNGKIDARARTLDGEEESTTVEKVITN